MRVAAYLQAQVVFGADARQHGQLLAPQSRHPATRAGNQPDILGPDLLPTCSQKFAQRVGLRCHVGQFVSSAEKALAAASVKDRSLSSARAESLPGIARYI